MLEFMLVYKNGFNSSCDYFKTYEEAMSHAEYVAKAGIREPEAIYKYNRETDRFEPIYEF